jgi:hypothetical protein
MPLSPCRSCGHPYETHASTTSGWCSHYSHGSVGRACKRYRPRRLYGYDVDDDVRRAILAAYEEGRAIGEGDEPPPIGRHHPDYVPPPPSRPLTPGTTVTFGDLDLTVQEDGTVFDRAVGAAMRRQRWAYDVTPMASLLRVRPLIPLVDDRSTSWAGCSSAIPGTKIGPHGQCPLRGAHRHDPDTGAVILLGRRHRSRE